MQTIKIIEQLSGNYFNFFDNDQGTTLHDFEGFESPEDRVSIDDVSGSQSSVYVNGKPGKRVFSFQADIISPEVYSLRRSLASALRLTGMKKLVQFTTYDGLQLQCEAEKTKYLNPYTHTTHQLLIELTAPDFRFYSQALKTFNILQTVAQGGAKIPAKIPMRLPGGSSDIRSQRILINAGNESTPPIFTIDGPGHGFTVINVVTGKSFVLSSILMDGDEVVIDTNPRKMTVIKNGTDNLYNDFSGDFWHLEPGENEINFLIGTAIGIDTLLNIQYRDAYNGL